MDFKPHNRVLPFIVATFDVILDCKFVSRQPQRGVRHTTVPPPTSMPQAFPGQSIKKTDSQKLRALLALQHKHY